jgi:C4-dicarboxylate-specific signal transduction histidine kinase
MTGTIADISESKAMQEKVDRLRRELEHVSRVNMLGELSSALAHELNQPLAAILSNAQAARRYIARNAVDLNEFSEILEDIIESDKRAGEVIRRMRLLLKKGDHSQEVIHMNELVKKIVELLNADIIDKKVRPVFELQEDLPPVFAGRVEITQVMLNLMINALEAMSSQDMDTSPEHERIVRVSTTVENENVIVTLSDTGPGIPIDLRKDVFRPFFTTKTTGLGMGLSICERILEVYGGRLWVEDPPNKIGACFRFCLPVHHEKGVAEK